MKILLIAHFCDEVGQGGNNRFNYLASVLVAQGHQVELVTSGFSHTTKRAKVVPASSVTDFTLTYVDEPAYTRNVSVRRFWAHRVMAKRLQKYLANHDAPDLIYCAVPSLAVADAASEYAQQVGKPLVIDVQDLWPEAFYMVAGGLRRLAFLFAPLRRQADRVYQRADAIVAVSKRYQERALNIGNAERLSQVLYLGTDLQHFDACASGDDAEGVATAQAEASNNGVTFVYLGTLGHSYDLKIAIRALHSAQQQTSQALRMVVLGDGPLQAEFEALAGSLGANVEFVGRLPYAQMVKRLVACDVALNVISPGAAQSIINKHADYAAAGLPVLSTQECSEYRSLLTQFNAGIHCSNASPAELAGGMVRLAEDSELRGSLGCGSRRMAETLFDRRQTYPQVERLLASVQETCL